MSVEIGCWSPWYVIVEWKTLVAVNARRIVLALTCQTILEVMLLLVDTLASMAITFAATAHSNVTDCIVVGAKHLRIVEHLVTERVQTIQRDSNVRRSNPLF